jgi:hypothetical protein
LFLSPGAPNYAILGGEKEVVFPNVSKDKPLFLAF